MAISITKAAAKHILAEINKRGHGVGMRLLIKESGCSGYTYDIDYADTIADTDQVFEQNGAKVIIDHKSYLLVDGTEIDYRQKDLNWQFFFRNPMASYECGCGESFGIANGAKSNDD